MAETHTVKPDGGGDYTTLAAAEDAQDGDLTGRGIVTFECYDGTADLGGVAIAGWSNEDSSNYLRIFVPLTERHDGTKGSSGAWIDVDSAGAAVDIFEDFVKIEGLRFNVDSAGEGTVGVLINENDNSKIDSNLFVVVNTNISSSFVSISNLADTNITIIIQNNIGYGVGVSGVGISLDASALFGTNPTIAANIHNNTIDNVIIGISMDENTVVSGTPTTNVTLENNICINNGTDFASTVVNGTITGNNNCSEDATANNWDGSGSIINQTPGDLFVAEGTDHHLKVRNASNAINTGKVVAGRTTDAIGTSIPNVGFVDMGALEATEIWVIKPDGGGDYTTLQSVEDALDGDLTNRGVVTFECYDGSADLGECTINGWTNADSSNYVRVFVPLVERHNGTSGSSGAWIDIDSAASGIAINADFVRVEGVRLNMDPPAPTASISLSSSNNVTIEGNLGVEASAGTSANFISVSFPETGTFTVNIKNNIMYGAGSGAKTIEVGAIAILGSNPTVTANIYNNTCDNQAVGISMEETTVVSGTPTLNVILENNICTNNGTDFDASLHLGNGTILENNNCSEDGTANTWDGSGSIINQTPEDLFVAVGSDHTLKVGSNAIDAGKTIATFDNDALHLESDNWRPQGDAWDMGALEKFSEVIEKIINLLGGINLNGGITLA